jgi:tetratricopeptide (TPR) repeat protein
MRRAGPAQAVRRLAGTALVLLTIAAAFLLGCQELFDSDVWWHVRAGQWIWEHRRVPALDPFTFASADRTWVDLHWLFQLMLAGAHRLGGVPGMIIVASAACAGVVLLGLTSRNRDWPMVVVAGCWLPAVAAMSARFDPRPEVLSLLGIAAFLALLFRSERRPALLWILPLIQVIWVNAHALFVLGPIILGAYWAERASRALLPARPDLQLGRRSWLHLGGATFATLAACLVNPYGLRGALFPLELFPKIASRQGPYKSYVGEFMDMRMFVEKLGREQAGADFYFCAECFLLIILPLSFIMPAVWRASRPTPPERRVGLRETMYWLSAAAGFAALAAIRVLFVSESGIAAWMARSAPLGTWILGLVGALLILLALRNIAGALLAAVGSAAQAVWMAGLGRWLFGREPGPFFMVTAAVLALVVAGLILRASRGQGIFRMLLTLAFGYLALSAVRNVNLFALVAGFVLGWNLGEWMAALFPELDGHADASAARVVAASTAIRVALCGLVIAWIASIVSGRFFAATGEQRAFGWHESPLAYAHAAARLAGRPGMPERALALDLRQAGVYLFHNAPQHKLYIDGRLEVPTRQTFEAFVRTSDRLRQGRPGWAETLRRMGDPLVLLDHEEDGGAEATLLAEPGWRCVFYDSIASVFVSSSSGVSDALFPSVDFAARHFRDPAWQAVAPLPWGIGEARALFRLSTELRRRPRLAREWSIRPGIMLAACDRLRQALAAQGGHASNEAMASLWSLMGTGAWNLVPDLTVAPPGPAEPWDPARGILFAQAAFCFQRALALDPAEQGALILLHDLHRARGMDDATRSIVEQMRQARRRGFRASRTSATPPASGALPLPSVANAAQLAELVAALLADGRPEAAVRSYLHALEQGIQPAWPTANGVAAVLLHLGRPAEARRVWERAQNPPSAAVRQVRIATCALAALEFEAALSEFHKAIALERPMAEAWFGLALIHTQRGEPELALAAARAGANSTSPTPAQQAFLSAIEALVTPYAAE